MELWLIILIISVAFIIVSGLVAMIVITYPISMNVYEEQLVRTSEDKWGRVCSAPENEEQLQMWEEGIKWGNANREYMQEVSVTNGDLKLYGEYYDFGGDSCVIVLPGRCESLMYSYYFAKPYCESGVNVLVIDTRCHGKSDGKYSSIGVFEAEDLKVWMDFIKKTKNIDKFWLHGICIGGSAALFAVSSRNFNHKISGIVLEGCFVNFRESFKQHMIEKKKPVFPVLDMVMFNIRRYAKVNVNANTPMKAVKKITCPILFLFGKKDIFSLPAKSQKLFEATASEDKRLVWFDKGGHSHLRINNVEKYDNVIKEFIVDYEKK